MGRINTELCKKARALFPNAVLIAESGYEDIQDIEDDAPFVDGFLIGHGLLTGKIESKNKICECGGKIKPIKHKSFSLLVGFHTDVDFRCEECNQWYGHETRPFFDSTIA